MESAAFAILRVVEILDETGISDCVLALRRGELVILPTDTVYGLGARALDEAAVRKIFVAKGRPETHPLIVHVQGMADARELVEEWPEIATAFAEVYWPGPLALILPRSSRVPDAVTGGGPTVALRSPAHPLAQELLRALGEPIAAPSANRYQTLSPTRLSHIDDALAKHVTYALDGGPSERGIESTVLDLSGDGPRVLRPGSITLEMLRVIDPRTELANTVQETGIRASPGLDRKHYAPRTPLFVLDNTALLERLAGKEVCAVVHFSARENFATTEVGTSKRDAPHVFFEVPKDARGYAHALFATLHDADAAHVAAILVESPPTTDEWLGVRDRLTRAANSENESTKGKSE